jgi:flagellar basal body-associated protein FliL
MGDVVDFGEGGEQQEPAPSKRKFSFPLLKILLIGGLCLLVLGVVITVSIVVVNVMVAKGASQTTVPVGEEYQDVLPAYVYSSQLPEMRLSTADKPAATVIVKVLIGYEKNNKGLENELTERQPQIRDFLRNYFSMKKAEDLGPTKERKIKEEIRSDLNGMMTSKGVRDILFEKLQTVEQ